MALYYYFPTKSALLKACFDQVMEGVFENLQQAIKEGRNGREKLRIVFTGHSRRIIDELSVAVVTMEENTVSPKDRDTVAEARGRFEHAL